MGRKVSVALEADVAGFVKPVEVAKKGVDDLGDKVDGLDRSLKKIPADAAKAGAAMKLLGGDANGISKQFDEFGVGGTNALKLIDKKIEDTRANVKRFAADFNRNGSLTSFDLWQSASKDLGGLERIKKQLAKALDDGAKDGGKMAGPSFMASLLIAGAGATPALGALIGSAVIGGGGLGLIGLGVVGQLKNPAVRAAFADFGVNAKAQLTSATSAFGPELVKAAGMLHTELDKISPQLRAIFDRFAPVFDKLLAGGVGFIDRLIPGFDALSKAAGPVLGELASDLPRLGGALTSMLQSISAGAPGAANALGGLFTVIDGLIIGVGKLVEGFELIPGPIQAAILVVGLLTATLLYLVPKALAAKAALIELGNGALAADTKLGMLARTAGKVALVLAALQIASSVFGHSDTTGVEATTKALDDLWLTGMKTSEATKHLDYDLGTLSSSGLAKTGNAIAAVIEGATGLGSVFDESLEHAKERIASLDAALAAEVRAGHGGEAAAQFNTLAEAAQKQGVSIDDVKKGLPQYQEALAEAAAANEKVATTVDLATHGIGSYSEALRMSGAASDEFAKKVQQVFSVTMSLDQATLGVAESLTRLNDSFKKNGRELDIHSSKGQANREAILAAVTANMQLYQAQMAAGMEAGDAAKAYDENTAALERQLRKAGLTSGQIDDLIGKYRGIPKRVDTEVAINGLTSAIEDLTRLIREINGLHDKTVTVTVKQVGDNPRGQSRGGGWATGGIRRAAVGMVVPPSDPGTVLMGEPQTGGEALIPLRGIAPMRAAMLGQIAMSGYGYNVVPQGVGSGGGALALSIAFVGNTSDAMAAGIQQLFYDQKIQVFAGGQPVRVQR